MHVELNISDLRFLSQMIAESVKWLKLCLDWFIFGASLYFCFSTSQQIYLPRVLIEVKPFHHLHNEQFYLLYEHKFQHHLDNLPRPPNEVLENLNPLLPNLL